MSSQLQWWLLVCGAGGDAGCDAGLVGAPGAPLWCVGTSSWCRCTWVCAVLGGCRRGVAGCCVLCFLFCACFTCRLGHFRRSCSAPPSRAIKKARHKYTCYYTWYALELLCSVRLRLSCTCPCARTAFQSVCSIWTPQAAPIST